MFNIKDYLKIGMVVEVDSYQEVEIEELLQNTFFGWGEETNGIEIFSYSNICGIVFNGKHFHLCELEEAYEHSDKNKSLK